jgi:hypothetical protein
MKEVIVSITKDRSKTRSLLSLRTDNFLQINLQVAAVMLKVKVIMRKAREAAGPDQDRQKREARVEKKPGDMIITRESIEIERLIQEGIETITGL